MQLLGANVTARLYLGRSYNNLQMVVAFPRRLPDLLTPYMAEGSGAKGPIVAELQNHQDRGDEISFPVLDTDTHHIGYSSDLAYVS